MSDEPAVITIPAVELLEVGTWATSTGEFTWTTEDLAAAVAAQDDPSIRTPIIKLGHIDPRFDGEPCVGRIENMRTSTDGMTLIGDLVGVPASLAKIVPLAFPSRSIEGYFGYATATGHKHRFVVTALALLGAQLPAVETLDDIETLYGVAAAQIPVTGTHVAVTHAAQEAPMPTTRRVAASVNIDDVRTEFYETQPPGSWAWVREIWSDFIIVDNDEGDLFRIPWSESGDGDVTFGTPERVVVQYVPAPADDDAAEETLALAARFTPRPDAALVLSTGSSHGNFVVRASSNTTTEEAPAGHDQGGESMTPEQLAALGLPEDATPEAITERLTTLAAAESRVTELEAGTTPTPGLPEGVTVIDESALEELRTAASRGAEAHDTLRRQQRDRFLTEAVSAGKFAPARRAHFEALYDADESGTRELVTKLAAGTVPLEERGHAGGGADTDDDAFYNRIFGATLKEAVNG